jgi:hypothetical protein
MLSQWSYSRRQFDRKVSGLYFGFKRHHSLLTKPRDTVWVTPFSPVCLSSNVMPIPFFRDDDVTKIKTNLDWVHHIMNLYSCVTDDSGRVIVKHSKESHPSEANEGETVE